LYVGKLHKPGVYCIDAYDGVEVWVNEEPQSLEIGLAVSDNRVYVPADNCLYCLDASNGSIIWVTENVFCYSCPTIAEDKVFIGTLYGDMCCYWAENGTEIWAFSTSRLVTSSPAVAYGKVYFGSKDDNVYCLNLTNGESIWRYVTDGAVQSSPAVADGKIYIGSNDHYLYCFDAFSGELLWRYETDYHIAQSPAIANNIVYFGPRRIIYAIGRLDGVPPDDTTYIPGFTFEAVLLGLIIVMYVFINFFLPREAIKSMCCDHHLPLSQSFPSTLPDDEFPSQHSHPAGKHVFPFLLRSELHSGRLERRKGLSNCKITENDCIRAVSCLIPVEMKANRDSLFYDNKVWAVSPFDNNLYFLNSLFP